MKNPILFPFETSSQHERKHQEQQSLVGSSEEQETSFVQGEVEKIKHKLDLKKKRQKKLRIIFGSLSGIIMFLLVVLGYFQYRLYTLSKEEKILPEAMTVINASTTPQDIIRMVGRHVLLPEGEPQIAEVRDVEKLKEQQAFFKNAENGDLIILYTTMIFIYRPSKDIVIASSDITGVGQEKP